MAQRRQIRVSRSLEGGGERPATGYGEPEAGAPNEANLVPHSARRRWRKYL
jgi:hypothetical protein